MLGSCGQYSEGHCTANDTGEEPHLPARVLDTRLFFFPCVVRVLFLFPVLLRWAFLLPPFVFLFSLFLEDVFGCLPI